MNNFVTRTISATVYAGLVVENILLGSYFFGFVFLLFSLLSVREFMHLMRAGVVQTILSMLLAAILFTACYEGGMGNWLSEVIYGSVLIVALVLELFLKRENPIQQWGYTLVSQVMIALPFALMTRIYQTDNIGEGKFLLLALFVLIWINDSGAYIIGSLMSKRAGGNHKMFARVSPNKSWEGLIGGLVFAMLGGWVLYVVQWLPTLPFAMVFAFLVSAFGTLGDLMESLFKRHIGVKDSGRLMPGHGGALDRFDSLLLASPVIWLLLLCWQV